MNKEQFIAAITKVGWSVKGSWNGLNDQLVSPSGKVTDIRVREDCLEPYSNKLYGGESNQMQAKWFYKDAVYYEKENFVAINNLLIMNN